MGQPEIIYIGNYTIYDYGDHVDIEPPNDDLKEELESYGKYRMCLYSDYFEYNDDRNDKDDGFANEDDNDSLDVPTASEEPFGEQYIEDWEPEEVMWIIE